MSLIFIIMLIIAAGLIAIGLVGKWIKEEKRMVSDFKWDDWFIYIAYVLLIIVLIFS